MKTNINKLIATIALCSIGFLSAPAFAGQDEAQRQITTQVHQAKQKLVQAQSATGAERQKLLAEHTKLMQKCMEDMNAMKPNANMTAVESEEWRKVCIKQMGDLLSQMKDSSKLQMAKCDKNMK